MHKKYLTTVMHYGTEKVTRYSNQLPQKSNY